MDSLTATVLFAELPGFAGLSSHLSSKEFSALLKECYELTNSTIRLHQGTLNNFSGDTFMAVFIPKKPGSAKVLPAIEATNELRERLEIFFSGKKLPVAVGFKAGIASGEAIVEEFGTSDEKHITVMGEAVGFATRLREFTEEGQILVNGEIFKTAKEQYNFQKLEPLPIRGSKNTLPVFELLGKKRTKLQPKEFSERKIASEMVGRDREAEIVEGHSPSGKT